MSEGWLNSVEGGAYAGVSVNTIRDAAQRGDLSGIKITPGSKRSEWRFRRADIDEWLERGRVTGVRRPRQRRSA